MSTNTYVSCSFTGNSETFQEFVLDTRLYVHVRMCGCSLVSRWMKQPNLLVDVTG